MWTARSEAGFALILLGLGCGRSTLHGATDAGVDPDATVSDFDGAVPDAARPSRNEWLRRLGGEGPSGSSALFDDAGNVFIAGFADLTSYAPDGTLRWARSLWGAAITSVALQGDRVVVVGDYGRAIDLGDGPLLAPDRYRRRFFVAAYTTEGDLRWSRGFGDVQISGTVSVDLDEAGNVYLGGTLRGAVDFGGGVIENDDHEFSQMYMASFTRDGDHRWSRGFDRGFRYDEPTIVVGNDAVYLSGLFAGPTSFGGETFVTSSWNHAFLASFTTEGEYRWSRALEESVVLRTDHNGRLFADGTVPRELIDDGVTRVEFDQFVGLDAANNVYVRDGDTGVSSYRPDGTLRWQRVFHLIAAAEVERLQVSVDAQGNVVAMGAFEGDVDVFDGDAEDGVIRGNGRFVASYASTGAARWVRRYGSPWPRRVHDVASDSDGNVYVTGTFTGDADFGELRATREESELYLASFAPDGSPRWARTFGEAGPSYLRHTISVNERGVTVAGVFSGSLDFGGDAFAPSGAYIARFTTEGRYRWSRNLGGTYAHAVSFAVDRRGVVHLVLDGALERFDDEGEPLGSTALPGGGDIALDPEGNVILAAVFSSGPIDFGGGPLEVPERASTELAPYSPRGQMGLAVASLTPAGEHRWSEVFEVPGEQGHVDIASDLEGNIVVLARGRDRCSFDCRPVAYSLTLLLSLDADGDLQWSHRLPGVGGVAAGPGLSLDERGNVYVTGNYLGALELGGRVLPEPEIELSDGFVAVFAPNGSLRWSQAFGGPFGSAEGQRVAPSGAGGAYVIGSFSGALNTGFTTRTSESTLDTFLVRFSPAFE